MSNPRKTRHPVRGRVGHGLIALALLTLSPLCAEELPRLVGLPVAEVLQILQESENLEIVFSERIVLPEMVVDRDPGDGTALELLDRILASHDLMAEPGPGGRWVVVPLPRSSITGIVRESFDGAPLAGVEVRIVDRQDVATSDGQGRFELLDVPIGTHTLSATLRGLGSSRVENVRLVADQSTEVEIRFEISITATQLTVVAPSSMSLSRHETAPMRTLASGDIAGLPVAGDDYVRAARLLPGTAGSDMTAQTYVRGGRADETLVLLDGLELLEPYHLKDFESALSIVPPHTVERMDFLSGGFPAEYGDRMSAVLDMTTIRSTEDRENHLRASSLDSQLGTTGPMFDGRGQLMLSGRFSTVDFAADQIDLEEDPRFWDAFGKLGFRVTTGQELRLEMLEANDDFRFSEELESSVSRTQTDYRSSYAWLAHSALLGSSVSLETIVSVGRSDRDRRGVESAPAREFAVVDRRRLDVRGFKHQGAALISLRHSIRWGVEFRDIDADYDYSSVSTAVGRDREILFSGPVRGRQFSLYASSRHRLSSSLTLELGARFDESEIVEDSHVSPRLSMAYAPNDRSVLRFAWGHHYQSQRANELQVEDGETTFFPDERAEVGVASFERTLRGDLDIRVEFYGKRISDPRVRYENLFDPVSRFPEVDPDRYRIAPQRAHARGLEIFLRRQRDRLDWWASYSYSTIEDEIDDRDVPRSYDQPHAATASLSYQITPTWSLGLNGEFHTGWPTTRPMLSQDSSGQPQVALGPLNDDRLGDYLRFDVRLRKSWDLKGGELALWTDVLNVFDRDNPRGYEYLVASSGSGGFELERVAKRWLGTVPIIGLDWSF